MVHPSEVACWTNLSSSRSLPMRPQHLGIPTLGSTSTYVVLMYVFMTLVLWRSSIAGGDLCKQRPSRFSLGSLRSQSKLLLWHMTCCLVALSLRAHRRHLVINTYLTEESVCSL
jgi:hypothetical protein